MGVERHLTTTRSRRFVRRLAVLFGAGALALASCAEATAVRVHVYTDVAWENGRRVVIAASDRDVPMTTEPLAEVTGPWASPDLGDFVLLPPRDRSGPCGSRS